MQNRKYMLELALRYLGRSGLAEKIMRSTDGFEIRYDRIPPNAFRSKLQHSANAPDNPNYYWFLEDYIHAVIACSGASEDEYSLQFTSKRLRMDDDGVRLFEIGWLAVPEQIKKNSRKLP